MGVTIKVSDEDKDLEFLSWHNTKGYHTLTQYPECTTIYLHRVIYERVLKRELTADEEVDHKDRDKSNNRRDNLRLATRSQNLQNMGISPRNTSGYKGVDYRTKSGKWRAQIRTQNGDKKHLGLFDTPELASEAYEKSAKEIHGEFYYRA